MVEPSLVLIQLYFNCIVSTRKERILNGALGRFSEVRAEGQEIVPWLRVLSSVSTTKVRLLL